VPLQGDAAPASVGEYEQLVLSSPNSSFVWIKYFAFLISLGELDKARALADRALQTINYRCAAGRVAD
jgi:rRNA biogenesis protein RRP5